METRSDLTRSEAVGAVAELRRDLCHLAHALMDSLDYIDAMDTPDTLRTYRELVCDQARGYLDATLAMITQLAQRCPPIGPDGRMRYTVDDAIDVSIAGQGHIAHAHTMSMYIMNFLWEDRGESEHASHVASDRTDAAFRRFWSRSGTFYEQAAGCAER